MKKKFYHHKISNLFVIQKIITIHYQELDKDYSYPEETHNFWEAIYADKNRVIIDVENNIIHLNKGEIVFLAPNYTHSLKCNTLDDANIFIITFDCKSEAMSYFNNRKLKLANYLKDLLATIIKEARDTFYLPAFNPDLNKLILKENSNLGGEQIIKTSLEQLLIYLIREENNKETSSISFISRLDEENIENLIIKYLNNNLYNKISLDDLASYSNYSKTFLCTRFKEKTNSSIIQYHLMLRLKEAKKLIKKNHTFSEIAALLNFDSLSHFTNTFKKHNKMSPSEYKSSIVNYSNQKDSIS